MNYKNEAHRNTFRAFVEKSPYKHANSFLAAIYILTSSGNLWKSAKQNICGRNLDLQTKNYPHLSRYESILLKFARDIHEDTSFANIHDLCDDYLISDKTFELIYNALAIARKGYNVIDVKKKFL